MGGSEVERGKFEDGEERDAEEGDEGLPVWECCQSGRRGCRVLCSRGLSFINRSFDESRLIVSSLHLAGPETCRLDS